MTYRQLSTATVADLPKLTAYYRKLDLLIRMPGCSAKKTEAQNKHGMVKSTIQRLQAELAA